MISRTTILNSAVGLFKVTMLKTYVIITTSCLFNLQQTQKTAKSTLKNTPFQAVTIRYRSTTPLNTIIMFVPQQEVSSAGYLQYLM